MSLQQRIDVSVGRSYDDEILRLLGVSGASDEEVWMLSHRRAGVELEASLRDQWTYDLFFHLDLLALNARAEARLMRRAGR